MHWLGKESSYHGVQSMAKLSRIAHCHNSNKAGFGKPTSRRKHAHVIPGNTAHI